MSAIDRIKQLRAELKQTGPDLTKQQAGGGDYAPPVVGKTRLRFIEYIELGVSTTQFKGAPKTKPRAQFGFELSGPKHAPKVLDDGRIIPHIIRFKEVVGNTPKNGYVKLFKAMSKDAPSAKNFVDLLGTAYLGTVSHYEFDSNGSKRVIAQLKDDTGYHIESVNYEDQETGEVKTAQVDKPVSPLKLFLWDYATVEDFDELFIDGEYDDGGSKNKLQLAIRSAENFVGSPVYDALAEAGRDAELEPVDPKARTVKKKADNSGLDDQDDEAEVPDDQEGTAKAPEQPAKATKTKAKASAPEKVIEAAKPVKPAGKPKAAAKPAKQAEPEDDDSDPLAGL